MLDDRRQALIIDFGMAVKTRPTPCSFLAPNRGQPYGRSSHPQRATTQSLLGGAKVPEYGPDSRHGLSDLLFGRQRPPATRSEEKNSASDSMDIDAENVYNCGFQREAAIETGASSTHNRSDDRSPISATNGPGSMVSTDRASGRNYFSVPLKPSRGWPCRCVRLSHVLYSTNLVGTISCCRVVSV